MSNKEHNRGQRDASRGKYNPDSSFLDWFASDSHLKKIDRDRSQYDKGYKNNKNQ